MDTEDNDDHQSVPMAQYNVRLVASVKDFKTQISDKSIGIWNVAFNSPIEFKELLWEKSSPFIHRGVNMDTNESGETIYTWMNTTPNIIDIGIFIALYDDNGHRHIKGWWLDANLTMDKIRVYVGKELRVIVHKYSENIKNKSNFAEFSKQLIRPMQMDRGGAASTEVVTCPVKKFSL